MEREAWNGAERLRLQDFAAERERKLGAAASYLATEVGQAEAVGEKGGTGPPTGGSAGVSSGERAAFLADLERAPQDILM